MRHTLSILVASLILTACGQAPTQEQKQAVQNNKVYKPFVCSTDGGQLISISLPNECGVEGIYCVMADDAYDAHDVHIKKDSCEYKMLLNLDVVSEGGGWT